MASDVEAARMRRHLAPHRRTARRTAAAYGAPSARPANPSSRWWAGTWVNGDALRPQRPRQPDLPHARAQARTSRIPRGIHPGDRCCLCGQPIWPLPDGKTGNRHADHDPGTTQYRGLANGTKCEQCGRSSSCGFLRNGRVPNESARLYNPRNGTGCKRLSSMEDGARVASTLALDYG
jgi:uncharacterized protein (DUF2237 family)